MKMKKNYLVVIFTSAICLFMGNHAITNSTGAPQGSSGSPASNGNTCARAGCHNGPAVSSETITITTDIPAAGFLENSTYTVGITADAGSRTVNRMGFQASVEDASGSGFAGTISVSNSNDTRKSGNYITHQFTGTTPSNGSKTWSFEWNSGTAADQATIYAAVNFANNDGGTAGDVIATETLVLNKQMNVGLSAQSINRLSMYPNPVQDKAVLASAERVSGELQIFDLQGKLQLTVDASEKLDDSHWQLNLEGLKAGVYLLKAKDGATIKFEKL